MSYGISKNKGGDSATNMKKMESCILQVMKGGKGKEAAIRICKASIFDEGIDTLEEGEMDLVASCKKEQYSEMFAETGIDKAWSKKLIDKLYDKGLDSRSLEMLLHEIREYFMKNKYWSLIKTIDDTTLDEIIDDCAESKGMMKNENGVWQKVEMPIEREYSETSAWLFADVEEFKEINEGETIDIQIMRTGKWKHPLYGEVNISEDTLNDVVKNFETRERGIDLAVDENHEPNHKALGWIKGLTKQGKDALFATIELTKMGADLISQGAYKYFSPEIVFNKRDEESGKTIKNLLIGGAFTNRPFFKAMQPLMASENVANQEEVMGSILLFNSPTMKTILDLLGKFAETQTLSKEDKELLQAKFSELSEDDKTEELSSAVAEAIAEAPAQETVSAEKVVEASETVSEDQAPSAEEGDEITVKASEYESMKALATQASKLIREKRKDLMTSQINALAFSETNKQGVILPKMVNEVVDFALSLSEPQSEKFISLVSKLQTVAASEIGHDSAAASAINADHVQFYMEKLHMSKEEAIAAAELAAKEV